LIPDGNQAKIHYFCHLLAMKKNTAPEISPGAVNTTDKYL